MSPHGRTPRVSIVIPCYDQARFLAAAIASAECQRRPAEEIIIVDDGSSDETSAVAARHAGVRVVRQRNAGLAAARNRGLRESTGEYLVFLDADDLLLPQAVAAGLAAFGERPEAALVFGEYRYVDADGVPLRPSEWTGIPRGDYASLLRGNCIGMHAAVMYRRRTLERFGGFDVRRRAAEDYDLYLRVNGNLKVCDNLGVCRLFYVHDLHRNLPADLHLVWYQPYRESGITYLYLGSAQEVYYQSVQNVH